MAHERRGYILTTHLRERYVLRTRQPYMEHSLHCSQQKMSRPCEECYWLEQQASAEAANCKYELEIEIRERLNQAEEERSCLNNGPFMAGFYERYGYDRRFQFLVDNDVVFVCVEDEGRWVVVTCLPSWHPTGRAHRCRVKYGHIKKRREEEQRQRLEEIERERQAVILKFKIDGVQCG